MSSTTNNNSRPSTGIVYVAHELLRPKNFCTDVRGPMDTEQFVSQGHVMLDLDTDLSLEQAISQILNRASMFQSHSDKSACLEDAKASLFVSCSKNLLANSIKSLGSIEKPTQAASPVDDDWLCAFCELSQLQRRHFVLARFKHPGALLNQASPVRLLMLIITPTHDKSTKCGLELGRTFASLLMSSQLRNALLAAQGDLQVRSLLMLEVQRLAGGSSSKLPTRHKYRLEPAVYNSIALATGRFKDDKCKSQAINCVINLNKSTDNNYSLEASDTLSFKKNPNASKLIELIYSDSVKPICLDGHDATGTQNINNTNNPLGDGNLWKLEFAKGFWEDFTRRLRYYPSDFKDAFVGPPRTFEKTLATIWFLYFGILLPIIAFSSLNLSQTKGQMGDLRKSILGQAIGGLAFALLGGQPLVIIMTTAPLCLYTKVIYCMCSDYGFQFGAMYAAVGLWNAFFLILYSLFGFSRLMKWCTRSTEEVFAMFIVVAFITDASKDMLKNFSHYYYSPACYDGFLGNANHTLKSMIVTVWQQTDNDNSTVMMLETATPCRRDTSLLFLFLMLATLWLACFLYRFNKTPFLASGLRNLLSDYALPISVIAMSFVGSYIFKEVFVEHFSTPEQMSFEMAAVGSLSLSGVLLSAGLGFTLSLLFFMDQNISAAMVCAPQHGLKKGSAYHFDLFVIAILNAFLTLYGLPMMHGVLPHSPLHARSLSDIVDEVDEGHTKEHISNCRENRVTALVAHLLILVSLLLIPNPIAYIPRAVLNGLFLYMAVTSLDGLQIFERILLIFTQQSRYPPNHYIRRCPQRKIHLFTLLQILQLLVMCLFGFSPINAVEMFFPVIILAMIPFRHKVVAHYIEDMYLESLDGKQ